MCKYLLDSNVLITASNSYYASDIVPSFWESIRDYHADEKVYSIDHVKNELSKGNDELANWAKSESDFSNTFFLNTRSQAITDIRKAIVEWANSHNQKINGSQKNLINFTNQDRADTYLIAYAKIHKEYVVVTLESRNEISIPRACKAFKVEYIHTFDMMRRLGIKY